MENVSLYEEMLQVIATIVQLASWIYMFIY